MAVVSSTAVRFQDTSSLDFGGVWISSDFYSHSGGYRLCLILKSTKIDTPTKQQRVTKPSQQIAVLALDDSTRKQWPCEGAATMRFEFPRNKFLRGAPNPSFSVNFSIREPVTINIIESRKGNLPASMRSWTSIPQDCIPFYLEYKLPSIFYSDAGQRYSTTPRYSSILTNCGSSITVKIENVQV